MFLSYTEKIRKFNRFIERVNGVNNEYTDSTKFSSLEAQILYEIGYQKDVTAADLCRYFDVDKGYLSRILKKLKKAGLLIKKPSEHDKRAQLLQLTDNGLSELNHLIGLSNAIVEDKIKDFSTKDLDQIIDAMESIQNILGKYY